MTNKKGGTDIRELAEMKRELEEITNENDRLKYFENLIKEFDKNDYNNDRKHFRSERRDRYNITTMGNAFDSDNMESYIPKRLLKACKAKDWDEIIFTGEVENLPDIAMDRALAYILKGLPQSQREVFYYRVIEGYTADGVSFAPIGIGISTMYINIGRLGKRRKLKSNNENPDFVCKVGIYFAKNR